VLEDGRADLVVAENGAQRVDAFLQRLPLPHLRRVQIPRALRPALRSHSPLPSFRALS